MQFEHKKTEYNDRAVNENTDAFNCTRFKLQLNV